LRALAKLQKKCCDLMVVNGPEAMHALETRVEIMNRQGQILETLAGTKEDVSRRILGVIQERLIDGAKTENETRRHGDTE